MLYTIICSSKTGNTQKLAQRAREVLGEKNEVPATDADLVLLGSWTDKGGLDPALEDRLGELAGKRVFLFGTCGFGGSQAYYDRVLEARKELSELIESIFGAKTAVGMVDRDNPVFECEL